MLSDPPAGPSAVCAAPDFYSFTELKHYAVTFTPDTISNCVINPNTDMKQFLEAPISRYVGKFKRKGFFVSLDLVCMFIVAVVFSG